MRAAILPRVSASFPSPGRCRLRAVAVFGGSGSWITSRSTTHVAGIGVNGDCLPSPQNRLELSSETDETGLPKPIVYFSYGENEKRMSDHAEKFMTEAWKAAGADDIWTFQRSAHTIGTCRMGTDANTSVVDGSGRSHSIKNLWIVDNSIFPSALPANPALTIMALALRSANAFLKQ